MRERTFIVTMIGLDLMLILAGGAMAWSHAFPRHPGVAVGATPAEGIISMILIAGIGSLGIYELNDAVFRLAESPASQRNARLMAILFAAAAVTGGLMGLSMG